MSTFNIGGKDVVVDDEFDYLLMDGKSWRLRDGYVSRDDKSNGKRTVVYLHRVIIGAERHQIVDHIDGDRANNRLTNLRFVSYRQNNLNCAAKRRAKEKHGFKGLRLAKNGKYEARIRDGIKQLYLGIFSNPVEAAYVYDMASIELHGEYGRRNFLPFVL